MTDYPGMTPAEICDAKLTEMRAGEEWFADNVPNQDMRNAARLSAYKRKRLTHDALHGYDGAMTAKGLA